MAIVVEVECTAVQHVRVSVHIRRGAEVVVHPVGLFVERPGVVHPLEDIAGSRDKHGIMRSDKMRQNEFNYDDI